jgi:hypothetical protein
MKEIDMHDQIVETDGIAQAHLQDLIDGRILAIRVPHYVPALQAIDMSERLLRHPSLFRYSESPNVLGVGMDVWECKCDCGDPWKAEDIEHAKEHYYSKARPMIADIRKSVEPYLSPIDKFRLELQEAWPAGANLGNIEGRPMFVGVARVFEDGAEALPHDDTIGRVIRTSPKAREFRGQLSCNVYLKVSPEGGELELWRERLSADAYRRFHSEDSSYGVRREALPPSAALLQPALGELILFDATRLHAVRKVRGTPRVAVSCFVGYRGNEHPLEFWS